MNPTTSSQEARVRDLFDLPEQVRKGDFVLKLAEGVLRAEETSSHYVVTPPILQAFDTALRLVGGALKDGRSQASYVHGSFGSGKSHFMAMTSLLLDDHESAWRVPELHALRAKHDWAGKKKVLQLRLHMVGQKDLESAIFGEYVRWARKEHPKAPVPPLFADEALFDDARRMLTTMGEAAFFAPMNGEGEIAAGWGDMSNAGTWSLASFDEAATSTDPELRAKLFSALATTHFRAFAAQTSAFVEFDPGLAILARHAKRLGFDAIVLFLDELVLWLASGASNAAWLHTEVQKTAKLVEAQDAARDVPFISFIAKQRDLAQLVGDEMAGAENKRLRESLQWFEGRFGTIDLEDRNLPSIVEKRILRVKDDAAKKRLDEAFATLQRSAASSWSTLLGTEDAEGFRKLYPFSPALVETLVALSSSLQRNRTSIKLLMEILTEHIPDLKLGDVVPVGDLFDVLAGGDDTADGVMKSRFESAKQLYRHHLLPLLHETHGTGTVARCQRLRPEHRVTLGCSGCPETACRNDNRLIKTLIIAALVSEVPALKMLTASRLVQLNHGTLRAPIPGTEANLAAQRLRNWASRVGQIHVGSQADPVLSVSLGTVDLGPILQQAREADTPGHRQAIVRGALFDELGVTVGSEWGQDHTLLWHGTKRLGHIRFGNVRRMGAEQLRCPDDQSWRIVVDYPFDEPGYGPNDDLEVVDRVRDEGAGSWTLVWLPSFFSEEVNRLVGEIAILDHILETREAARRYVQHLRVEQQNAVISDLDNLRNQKRARLRSALLQAYGISRETEADIDPSRSLASHLHVLKQDVRVQAMSGGTLRGVVDDYAGKMLEARYPRHPAFPERALTKQTIERVLELFSDLLESDEKRLQMAKDDAEKLRDALGLLGIIRITETTVFLVEDLTLQMLERKRAQKSVDHPSVAELKRWLDENDQMGLTPPAADLVVRAYARWSARTLTRYGQSFTPHPGSELPSDVVLEKPELPSMTEWSAALALAGAAFGLALPRKALFADNVKRFEGEVGEHVRKLGEAPSRLVTVLRARQAAVGLAEDVDRLKTARSAEALVVALRGKKGTEQVRVLATFHPETSATAVGTSLKHADAVATSLADELVFGVFDPLLHDTASDARAVCDELSKALRQDEALVSLAPRVRELAVRAQEVIRQRTGHVAPFVPPLPPADPNVVVVDTKQFGGPARQALDSLRSLVVTLEHEIEAHGDAVTVVGHIQVVRKGLSVLPLMLTRGDLKEALDRIFQTTPEGESHKRRLIAIHGTGDAGLVDTPGGSITVIPVASELDLRARLPPHDDETSRIAFLVPWTGHLALDVAGRFIGTGRIYLVGPVTRLRRVFRAKEIDDAATASPLAKYLIAHPPRDPYPGKAGRLTVEDMWATWLTAEWDAPTADDWSVESLLAWSVTNARGPKFVERMAQDGADVRAAAAAFFDQRLGSAASVVWRSWELGQGRAALELAAVFDAVSESQNPAVALWTRMKARELPTVTAENAPQIARALGQAANGAFGRLADNNLDVVLAAAELRVDDDVVRGALIGSRWLPAAWADRLDALGNALKEGAATPTAGAVKRATELLGEVEHHRQFTRLKHPADIDRGEMAIRLLAFLASRTDLRTPRGLSTYADVEQLARWYSEDGGFVDLARSRARGSAQRAFGQGIQAVVAAADALRVAMDRRFAKGLVAWHDAGSPSNQVMPIGKAAEKLVAEFTKGNDDRRVLVLLMDGMGWAQAVEILTDLQSWGPIAWNRTKANGGAYVPVLAALPTITEVSRAAFFAGKELPPVKSEATEKDTDRWANHAAIRKFCRPGDAPRLLLRGEGHTLDGSATKEALSLIRDEQQRVVAIVINAIDSSLKGDTQQRHRWTVDSIRSLGEILNAARDSGRVVYLCSDHGHVPGDTLTSVGLPPDAKPRWRPAKDATDLQEYEVFVSRDRAWAPGTSPGIALLADDAHRYGGGAHVGEHGGAALAEVVAPHLFLGYDGGVGGPESTRDHALAVAAPYVPLWWHFEVLKAPTAVEPEPVVAPRPPVAAAPTPQLSLLPMSEPIAPAPPKHPSRPPVEAIDRASHPIRDALAKSRLFESHALTKDRRKTVLDTVGFLASRDGYRAPVGAYATVMNVLPPRAPNLISFVSEVVNVDGYAVLRHDVTTGLVHLDVSLLEQLYELKIK